MIAAKTLLVLSEARFVCFFLSSYYFIVIGPFHGLGMQTLYLDMWPFKFTTCKEISEQDRDYIYSQRTEKIRIFYLCMFFLAQPQPCSVTLGKLLNPLPFSFLLL